MTNTTERYDELESFMEFMEEEVCGIKVAIEYTERFMMDESPTVPQFLAEMKAELAEATEALELARAYSASLATYNAA